MGMNLLTSKSVSWCCSLTNPVVDTPNRKCCSIETFCICEQRTVGKKSGGKKTIKLTTSEDLSVPLALS